jgi:hypothetical protein
MNTSRKTPIDPLEAEIDAIRIKLYEKTKGMTADEEADYFNRRTRDILKAHGLTNVKILEAPSPKDAPVSHP